jgi:hypothetical protein
VFENRVLRRIFGPKREVVWGEASPNIIWVKCKENEMDEICSTHGRDEKSMQSFGHSEDKSIDGKVM